MATRTAKSTPARFDTDIEPSRPELASAAGLLMALLKTTHMRDLVQFAAEYNKGTLNVELASEQAQLLHRHRNALAHVSVDDFAGSTVTTTLAVCNTCGEHLYLSSTGTVPAKCVMTLGCVGTGVKAKAARKSKP